MEETYAVYMMSNRRGGVLYVGVTSDLPGRVHQHRTGAIEGFTKRYRCTRLIWFTSFSDVEAAIHFEKRLKRWRRAWKIHAIETSNPRWDDLWLTINGSVADGPLGSIRLPPEVAGAATRLRPS